mgnify:CR=1 FL=1
MTAPRSVEVAGRIVLLVDEPNDLNGSVENAVIVCAAPATLRTARALLRGTPWLIVLHDAGVGKDGAGIAGLERLADVGQAAVAVGHHSARIGDPDDVLANGEVVHPNGPAAALGVRPGPLREQLARLGDASDVVSTGPERVA